MSYLPTTRIRHGAALNLTGHLGIQTLPQRKANLPVPAQSLAVHTSKPRELIDGNRFQENLEIPVAKLLFKMHPGFLTGES